MWRWKQRLAWQLRRWAAALDPETPPPARQWRIILGAPETSAAPVLPGYATITAPQTAWYTTITTGVD